MGGNTRAINRSTGELVTYAGRPAYADKIDMRSVDRTTFKKDFVAAMIALDELHRSRFGEPIWPAKTRNSVLSSGEAFNGSSEHLFSNKVSDDDFSTHKPVVGDVDLTVPSERIESIFELLTDIEGQSITDKVSYVGQNRAASAGHQINSLFAYSPTQKSSPLFVQIDFEAVEYAAGKPDEFSKFSHSSSWQDITVGVKGVFHKYLLRSLASMASTNPDVVLLTDKSPLQPPEKIKVKKTTSPVTLLSFSVDRGLRTTAVQQFLPDGSPVMVAGKLAYKEISTSDSTYVRTKTEIFSLLFGTVPSASELIQLDSFTGVLRLMKDHLDDGQVEEVYLDTVQEKLYGSGQALDLSNPSADMSAKSAALTRFQEEFPFLKSHDNMLKDLQQKYYASYKVRVSESRFWNLRNF